MRKIIMIVIAMVFAVNTAAHAEVIATTQSRENVSKYAHKAIPDVTDAEITACYDAVRGGTQYSIKRKKVMIECGEEEMVVFRRFF